MEPIIAARDLTPDEARTLGERWIKAARLRGLAGHPPVWTPANARPPCTTGCQPMTLVGERTRPTTRLALL